MIDTVRFSEKKGEFYIIDQTKLPKRLVEIKISSLEEAVDAIKKLKVRGAPAIGVASAMSVWVCAYNRRHDGLKEFKEGLREDMGILASARPTAVNLTWAIDQMNPIVSCGQSVNEVVSSLENMAATIWQNDINICKQLGEKGFEEIKQYLNDDGGINILTHCNAGRLAAVRYGTALAPIYIAKERGVNVSVYADETRPLLQGARLTAFELSAENISVKVQCDNMAASLMKSGNINCILVGADRIAANGDVANKIGTLQLAIIAKYYNVPFYVVAPTSTIDKNCLTGQDIIIEHRADNEVSHMWYKEPMIPEGADVYNPAFDVTEHNLITGIITEKGIIKGNFNEEIKELLEYTGAAKI